RADRIPSRLVSRFSARRTPQGSGIDSAAAGRPTCGVPVGLGLNGPVTVSILSVCSEVGSSNRIASSCFGTIQRPVGGDQQVSLGLIQIELGHPDAHGDQAGRIA